MHSPALAATLEERRNAEGNPAAIVPSEACPVDIESERPLDIPIWILPDRAGSVRRPTASRPASLLSVRAGLLRGMSCDAVLSVLVRPACTPWST